MEASKEELFSALYKSQPDILSSAPGRINLIGEHTDYVGGYVLPAAINLRNNFLAGRRKDGEVHIWAGHTNERKSFSLADLFRSEPISWLDYVKGIFWVLKEEGFDVGGINGLLWGDIPLAAGLSSSAALEICLISGLAELFRPGCAPEKLAVLAQKAENDFVGVNCGLMDQYISMFGQKNAAMFLDCETLERRHYPLDLEKSNIGILVYDTRVHRELASSEYNKRRLEAFYALEFLQSRGVQSFKKATSSFLSQMTEEMAPLLLKRAKHIISENERVRQALNALNIGDFSHLGRLLFLSHESLRDDYEVSCPELDLVYETGKTFSGCFGARLVGAGFGGSAIALLHKDRMEDFKQTILREVKRRKYETPAFHEISIGNGSSVVRLK